MSKIINLIGQKFGRLMVIKRAYPNAKDRNVRWLCKCECGEEKIVTGGHLRGGSVKSCGCLKREKAAINGRKSRLSPGLAHMRKIISDYKSRAKKRGFGYELTEKQFKEITQKDCYYCGIKPSNIAKDDKHYGDYIYNGLDRIDNNKGYIMGNIVPCCNICNQAKKDYTIQEFKDWIKRVYDKMFI